jgi:hypothetical protein
MTAARQHMQEFVESKLVAPAERSGETATGKIDSCWRESSWRINCHVIMETHKTLDDGYDVHILCSSIFTAYTVPGYLRIKNVTHACNAM